jgi:coenzyme Q-binding protein COQ10
MTTYTEKKIVPYTPAQLHALVGDVAKYPSFLPWCTGARIRSHVGNDLVADLTIGFGPFRESFTSRVTLGPPDATGVATIRAEYENGPFKYLHNKWKFSPAAEGCLVDFYVDFEFRNFVLQKAIGAVFGEAVRLMVTAFLRRARTIYGAPKPLANQPPQAVAPPQSR